jgi:hypothetical protein
MRRGQATIDPRTISRQASKMRVEYPELHAYLAQRDETLRRALADLPSEEDIELCAVQRPIRHIETTLRNLGPGIDEIAG